MLRLRLARGVQSGQCNGQPRLLFCLRGLCLHVGMVVAALARHFGRWRSLCGTPRGNVVTASDENFLYVWNERSASTTSRLHPTLRIA